MSGMHQKGIPVKEAIDHLFLGLIPSFPAEHQQVEQPRKARLHTGFDLLVSAVWPILSHGTKRLAFYVWIL